MAFDLDDDELKATREMNGLRKLDSEYYFEKSEKMFKDLGYKLRNNYIDTSEGTYLMYQDRLGYTITFENHKVMKCYVQNHITSRDFDGEVINLRAMGINMAELEAINLKCKALGWI